MTRALRRTLSVAAWLLAGASAFALPSRLPGPSEQPASNPLPGDLGKVGFDQHLGQQLPLDTIWLDESGRTVKLGDYFGQKPVLLAFLYHRCPMLCTLVQNSLAGALKAVELVPGRDFEIVMASFDPRDTPASAAGRKGAAVARYGHPESARGWHYLTGSPASITKLTDAAGFRYVFDLASQQFAHASGLVLVTADGRLSRYLYGIEFAPRDLRLGLVEASAGKIGGLADHLLLLCFHYDAKLGKYSAATMTILRGGAALTLVALALGIGGLLRRERRLKRISAGGIA